MSGARVEITDAASPTLRRLLAKMQGDGREQLLGHMGEYVMRSTRERAEREVAPDGKKWRALSPDYAKWKQKQRPGVPILKFDFHMLGDQFSYQVDPGGVLVGTNAPYGAIHQFGGTIRRAAHSRKLTFGKDKPSGMKVFAKAHSKEADHEKWATVDAYDVTIEARPWLGISDEDAQELLDITTDHLGDAFEGG